MHADVHKLEESSQCSLIANDGLHVSFSGYEMMSRNIISVSKRICLGTAAPQSALNPPSAQLPIPEPKFQSIWDDEMSNYGITIPDAYSSVLSRTPIQQPPQMGHIPDISCELAFSPLPTSRPTPTTATKPAPTPARAAPTPTTRPVPIPATRPAPT